MTPRASLQALLCVCISRLPVSPDLHSRLCVLFGGWSNQLSLPVLIKCPGFTGQHLLLLREHVQLKRKLWTERKEPVLLLHWDQQGENLSLWWEKRKKFVFEHCFSLSRVLDLSMKLQTGQAYVAKFYTEDSLPCPTKSLPSLVTSSTTTQCHHCPSCSFSPCLLLLRTLNFRKKPWVSYGHPVIFTCTSFFTGSDKIFNLHTAETKPM